MIIFVNKRGLTGSSEANFASSERLFQRTAPAYRKSFILRDLVSGLGIQRCRDLSYVVCGYELVFVNVSVR